MLPKKKNYNYMCIPKKNRTIVEYQETHNMAINVGLSAMARIELLDNLLRQDKWWTKEQLRKEVSSYIKAIKDKSISDATLRNDLEEIKLKAGDQFLEEKGARNIKKFKYADRNFSIYNIVQPDPVDMDFLQQAVELIQQIKGFALSEELKSILLKLKYVVPASPEQPIIQFDDPERFEGMDLLQQLYEAIRDKKVIEYAYQAFTEAQPQVVVLHPYLLKKYNHRWFLIGLNHTNNRLWISALDRFKSDPKIKHRLPYIAQLTADFDARHHFAHVVGVTVPENTPVEKVVLKFTPHRAPYVLTKPLHSSQQLVKTYANGAAQISYALIPNKELEMQLLSFGPDVEIIKPLSLREKMKKLTTQLAALYQ